MPKIRIFLNYKDNMFDANEIIDTLGGTCAVARSLRIAPSSVSEWRDRNCIPSDKLMRVAASLEDKTDFRISRKSLFPKDWREIWPELIND